MKIITNRSVISELHKQEIQDFGLQEDLSFQLPSVKYAGKQFLIGSHNKVYQKYLHQEQSHSMGVASKSTMYRALSKITQPESKFPMFEALYKYDENIRHKITALCSTNVKGIQCSRLKVLSDTLCVTETPLSGTTEKFCSLQCYQRTCPHCGTEKL